MHGKLVSQNSNDQSAHELLKSVNFYEEKEISSKNGILENGLISNKPKQHAALPSSWQLLQLGQVLRMTNGRAFKTSEWTATGLPIVRIQNLNNHSAPFNFCDPALVSDRHIIQNNSILISWSGTPGTSFGAFIWSRGKAALNQHIFSCFLKKEIYLKEFLVLAINAKLEDLIGKAKGGVGLQHVTKSALEELQLVLPPIDEQKRILKKYAELMKICDRLEVDHQNSIMVHRKLVDRVLSNFTPPFKDGDSDINNFDFFDNFDELFMTQNSVAALKDTVLQLAITGKLVHQNKSDSSILDFLEAKDISSQQCDISGWRQVSLGNLGDINGGGTPSKANEEYWDGDIPWISPKDMKVDYIDNSEDKISQKAIDDSNLKIIPSKSILMVVRGMILAHSFPVAITNCEVSINQDMKALTVPIEIVDFVFLNLRALRSKFVSMVDRSGHGTCKLTSQKLWKEYIVIPPLEEQERIIKKVFELFSLCDQLHSLLTRSKNLQREISDALVTNALK
jgi:type I restriction enzyme S subunit